MDLKGTIKMIHGRLQIQGKNIGKYNGRDGVYKNDCGKIVSRRNGRGWNEDLNYEKLDKNTNFEIKTTF